MEILGIETKTRTVFAGGMCGGDQPDEGVADVKIGVEAGGCGGELGGRGMMRTCGEPEWGARKTGQNESRQPANQSLQASRRSRAVIDNGPGPLCAGEDKGIERICGSEVPSGDDMHAIPRGVERVGFFDEAGVRADMTAGNQADCFIGVSFL
jgi:hypothetical protein